jgi:hypothetical protein
MDQPIINDTLQNEENSDGDFQCKQCSRQLENEINLTSHMWEIHSCTPRYFCRICGSDFKRIFNLDYHYRYSHSELKLQTNMSVHYVESQSIPNPTPPVTKTLKNKKSKYHHFK